MDEAARVETKVGCGTTFFITLPVAATAGTKEAAEALKFSSSCGITINAVS